MSKHLFNQHPFKAMNSYSQAGQDKFVHALIPGDVGTFLDIGCAGKEGSNTLGLEELGWTGILMDSRSDALNCPRKSLFICADATSFNWSLLLIWRDWDYLSLDIDDGTLDALKQLLLLPSRFRVITIEHDAYRLGDKLRVPERELLTKAGYVLVRPDVCAIGYDPTAPFEDWWTCPELAEAARNLK
jgi:hypothetical protein